MIASYFRDGVIFVRFYRGTRFGVAQRVRVRIFLATIEQWTA